MAELTRFQTRIDPASVLVTSLGGDCPARMVYENGRRTDTPVTWRDGAVRRFPGSISVDGSGLPGADIETVTPLEEAPAGMVYRAEGVVELAVRADARPGFGDRGPRGVLALTVRIERLVPVGNVMDLLRQTPTAPKRGGDAS